MAAIARADLLWIAPRVPAECAIYTRAVSYRNSRLTGLRDPHPLRRQDEGSGLAECKRHNVGIRKGFNIQQTTTLGQQLVSLLVDQLAGELDIQRANPTAFSLHFPLVRV